MVDQIRHLTGAERVRLRPTIVFGSVDMEKRAFEMLLNVMAAECRHGYASQITITLHQDSSVTLQDNGRGLYLGSFDDNTTWKSYFCDLFCKPSFPEYATTDYEFSYFENNGKIHCKEYESETYDDLYLCALQYVSEYMDVVVRRDGVCSRLHFKRGKNIGGIHRSESNDPSGTSITLKLDAEVFPDPMMTDDSWIDLAKRLAIGLPGKQVILQKERNCSCENQVFHYPNGIQSFLSEQIQAQPIFHSEIAAAGKDRYNRPEYGARVRVALCFSHNAGFILALHNGKRLTDGSTHIERIIHSILDQVNWKLDRHFSLDELRRHLCLVVETTTTKNGSTWSNGTRNAINNNMIADMAQDCMNDDFGYFVKQNRKEIAAIYK